MKQMMKDLQEYVSLRRTLGSKLERTERALRGFVAFLEKREAPL